MMPGLSGDAGDIHEGAVDGNACLVRGIAMIRGRRENSVGRSNLLVSGPDDRQDETDSSRGKYHVELIALGLSS
jgi:hypothetical protein